MRVVLIALLITFSSIVFASSGVSGDHHIPVKTIVTQVINLGIALVILVVLTRKAISNHFEARHKDFHKELKKAESAKMEAEMRKKEVSTRLSRLESTAEEAAKQAHSEAERLKAKMVSEAKTLSTKLEQDALRQAKYEHDKAVFELRDELLKRSLEMAEEKMKDGVDGSDLARLRGEFVDKIQVVQ